jgi:hypothetical protein
MSGKNWDSLRIGGILKYLGVGLGSQVVVTGDACERHFRHELEIGAGSIGLGLGFGLGL